MDSDTHVLFGLRLLKLADHGDRRASGASLFPQIDRKPAYFHRLFAHCLEQVPTLISSAEDVDFWAGASRSLDDADPHYVEPSAYVGGRLRAERARIDKYCQRHAGVSLSGASAPPADAVRLCIVSHIYNDTFNNPVQAFAPRSSIPSGAWQLWDEMETLDFRRVLYSPERIEALRGEFFDESEWNIALPADLLCAAMIIRIAGRAAQAIDTQVWLDACEGLGVAGALDTPLLRTAIEFFTHQDCRLADLFHKYGR